MMDWSQSITALVEPEARPVTRTELLDCLAWMDALLEAGWTKGTSVGWSKRRPGHAIGYPDLHCLIGAAAIAVREVRPSGYYYGVVLQSPTVFGALVGVLADALGKPLPYGPEDFPEVWPLMDFNDSQVSVEPVRALVQKAAERIGSK